MQSTRKSLTARLENVVCAIVLVSLATGLLCGLGVARLVVTWRAP